MRQFSSGMLGCAICILALLGSILGASIMTADQVDVPITTYNYIADVTGTFDTTTAPEYINYDPAANYVGYTVGTMDYTDSNTANAYRYIVSYPRDVQVNETITETTTLTVGAGDSNFTGSEIVTQVFLEYTGGGYNFGTTETTNGLSYNAYIDDNSEHYPYVTALSRVVAPFVAYADSNGDVSINITHNGTYPLLMALESGYSSVTLSDGQDNIWYLYKMTVPSVITRIVWNVDTDYVTAYSGSTVAFTGFTYDVNVYYRYYCNANNTVIADVNTTFSDTVTGQTNVVVTKDSSYPLRIGWTVGTASRLDVNNTAQYHSLPVNSTAPSGYHPYNIYVPYTIIAAGITNLSAILDDLNIPSGLDARIYITHGEYPVMFIYNAPSSYHVNDETHQWCETNMGNFPEYIIYNGTTGNVEIQYRDSNVGYVTCYNGSPDNVSVIYRYYYKVNNITFQLAPTISDFTCVYTRTVTQTITPGYSTPNLFIFQTSDAGTMALINWDGTYDMGVGGTYQGISYTMPTGQWYDNDTWNIYPDIWTLDMLLDNLNVPSNSEVTLTIVGNADYPVLFYYGNWTQTTLTIGTDTQYIYTATLNENNSMPDSLYIVGNSVVAYRNGAIIYTGNADSIYMINKYSVNSGSGFNVVDTYAAITGQASIDSDIVTITVNNNSDYPSDAYRFSTPGHDAVQPFVTYYKYLYPLIDYTGTAYNNMGLEFYEETITKNVNICLTNGERDNTTTYMTRLTNILSSIGLANYHSLDLRISYGTHPILFVTGNWDFTIRDGGTAGVFPTQYNNMFYYYWKTVGDNAFPDRLTYNTATGIVTLYRNGVQIGTPMPAKDVQVIYKYWIFNDDDPWIADSITQVTDQSMTFTGTAQLIPTYKYANPEKGVNIKDNSITMWKNGYKNNTINILWAVDPDAESYTSNLRISAGTSAIVITKYPTYTEIFITKQNGDTDVRNIGNWYRGQLTINVSQGTLTITPIAGHGLLNFMDSPIEPNDTSYVWNNWYTGDTITSLSMSTSGKSLRFGVNGTSVFLETYGVVMFDPSLDIETYFPNMTEWRLNFYSFALVGDSIIINNVTYPVNKTNNTITLTDVNNRSTTGTLNNINITKEITGEYNRPHYYFTFANENKSIDLGEVQTNTISFGGMWFFTTGLYELTEGTTKEWSWMPTLNLDFGLLALLYIGMIGVAIIIGKGLFHMEMAVADWIILIFSSIVAIIIAGGFV